MIEIDLRPVGQRDAEFEPLPDRRDGLVDILKRWPDFQGYDTYTTCASKQKMNRRYGLARAITEIKLKRLIEPILALHEMTVKTLPDVKTDFPELSRTLPSNNSSDCREICGSKGCTHSISATTAHLIRNWAIIRPTCRFESCDKPSLPALSILSLEYLTNPERLIHDNVEGHIQISSNIENLNCFPGNCVHDDEPGYHLFPGSWYIRSAPDVRPISITWCISERRPLSSSTVLIRQSKISSKAFPRSVPLS